MKKVLLTLIFLVLLVASVQACGWFSYEDIEGTRVYYDAYDNIAGIHDTTLLMSRLPTEWEKEKNVFIPMN